MPDKEEKSISKISKALENMRACLQELQELQVLTNKKDLTCQIGEWLIERLYGGNRAVNGVQIHWDILNGEERYQVKTHAKAATTPARWSVMNYEKDAEIDILFIIVFTADYKLISFYKIPWQEAVKRISHQKDRGVLYWDHVTEYKVAVPDLPHQEVIRMFI